MDRLVARRRESRDTETETETAPSGSSPLLWRGGGLTGAAHGGLRREAHEADDARRRPRSGGSSCLSEQTRGVREDALWLSLSPNGRLSVQ